MRLLGGRGKPWRWIDGVVVAERILGWRWTHFGCRDGFVDVEKGESKRRLRYIDSLVVNQASSDWMDRGVMDEEWVG